MDNWAYVLLAQLLISGQGSMRSWPISGHHRTKNKSGYVALEASYYHSNGYQRGSGNPSQKKMFVLGHCQNGLTPTWPPCFPCHLKSFLSIVLIVFWQTIFFLIINFFWSSQTSHDWVKPFFYITIILEKTRILDYCPNWERKKKYHINVVF